MTLVVESLSYYFPATLDLNCTVSEEVFINDYTDLFGQSEESRLSRHVSLTSPDFRLCLLVLCEDFAKRSQRAAGSTLTVCMMRMVRL
jgi:hypothetical protein